MSETSILDRLAKMAETQAGKSSLPGRSLWRIGGILSYQAIRNIGWVMAALAIVAVLFWDTLVLPFYEFLLIPVTFVAILFLLLSFFTIFLVFNLIRRQAQDPVRRNAKTFVMALGIVFALNLIGLLLFSKAWEFYSPTIRWICIILVLVNFVFCFILLFIFIMGWNRNEGWRRQLNKHHINKIYQPAKPWYQLPHFLNRMEMVNWQKGSSFSINALYMEFLSRYREAVDLLTESRLELLLEESGMQKSQFTRLQKETECCLRSGHTLAKYCGFFNDINDNHQLLAQEFYWRLINIKLLYTEVLLERPEANHINWEEEVADLSRVINWYLISTTPGSAALEEESPVIVIGILLANYRKELLEHRLFSLYLAASASQFLEKDQVVDNSSEHQLAFSRLLSNKLASQLSKFKQLSSSVDRHIQEKTTFLNKRHFIRKLWMENELPSIELTYLKSLRDLAGLFQEEIEQEEISFEEVSQWNGIPYHIDGLEVSDLKSDVTHLLTITPALQEEDNESMVIPFPALWKAASVIWVLKDLVYFERSIPAAYFKELIQEIQVDKFPAIIRPEIRRLLNSKIAKRRWNENCWLAAQRSGDHFEAFRHSLE